MSESAGRVWVAKYLGDGRAVEREQERQEKSARDKAPTIKDVTAHEHVAPAPVCEPIPARPSRQPGSAASHSTH
jgi:hypothetical protein